MRWCALAAGLFLLIFASGCAEKSDKRQRHPRAKTRTVETASAAPGSGVPVPIQQVTHVASAEIGDGNRQHFALVAWRIGPACALASASEGRFSNVDVKPTGRQVELTLRLAGGKPNPRRKRSDGFCTVGLPTFWRLIPLGVDPSGRPLIDTTCGCRPDQMSKAEASRILGTLSVR